MGMFTPVNLWNWIEEHKDELKPPVSNQVVWRDDRDTIVFVSGGPNTRNDYHVNPTEEFFYQLKGDMHLPIVHEDGRREVIQIREGEIYLLPAWVPHSPQRPADTIGLIIELKRPEGAKDALRWYCDNCNEIVYEEQWTLENIALDLKRIMERFWTKDDLRTCKNCGTKVEKAEPAETYFPANA